MDVIGIAFADREANGMIMSKQEIFKIINSSMLRLVIVFIFAAIAGVAIILSLSKLLVL